MASNTPGAHTSKPETAAVVCVVDSSLALLAEWPRLFQEYITPLFQRLHENYPVARLQFRVAIVCYAPATHRPKPLLSVTFFGHPTLTVAKLHRGYADLGIGQTGGGGARGMAVLEGLVSSIELFDLLKESEPNGAFTCHILHLAASPPDSSERPLWNTSPQLDGVTWDSLPAELRKRDINYSQILLRPIPKLTEFYSALVGTSQAPWFQTRPNHIVKLMGYPLAKGKRPAPDSPTVDTHKKPRVLPPKSPIPANNSPRVTTNTPKLVPAAPAPPAAQQHPPSSSQPPIQPRPPQVTPLLPAAQVKPPNTVQAARPAPQAAQPVAGPSQAPQATQTVASTSTGEPRVPDMSQETLNQLKARCVAAEQALFQKATALRRLQVEGKQKEYTQQAQTFQADMQKLGQFKKFLSQAQKVLQARAAAGKNQPQNNPPGPGPQPSMQPTSTSEAGPSTAPLTASAPPAGTAAGFGTPGLAQAQVQVQAAQSKPPVPALPHNVTPEMAAQMQKMLEQRNRTPHMPPTVPVPEPQAGPSGGAGTVTASQMAAVAAAQQRPLWRGYLRWSGTDAGTNARREMFTQVIMRGAGPTQGVDLIQTQTWPPTMHLAPSREQAVDMETLQTFIKKHQCMLFSVMAIPNTSTGDLNNEENHKALVRLLTEKNLYALAAWPPADGKPPENRILLFTTKSTQLLACYFMTPGGMPELPKSTLCGVPLHQIPPEIINYLQNVPAEQQALLNAQPLAKRRATIEMLYQRVVAQSQAQGQIASPQQPQGQMVMQQGLNRGVARPGGGPMSAFMGGGQPQQQVNPLLNTFPSAAAQQQQQQMQMAQGMGNAGGMMNYNAGQLQQMVAQARGLQPGMHQRNPSGGMGMGMANLSQDVLQSFMQRKQMQEGSNQRMG